MTRQDHQHATNLAAAAWSEMERGPAGREEAARLAREFLRALEDGSGRPSLSAWLDEVDAAPSD